MTESPLGDLSYLDGSGGDVEVFKSETEGERAAQSLRFIVKSEGGDQLTLCWVDPESNLHHYYSYEEGIMDHDEGTYTGDAFVIYRVIRQDAPKPQNVSDLSDKKSFVVLCSYRLGRVISSEHTHCVQCNSSDMTTSCQVTSVYKGDDEYRVEIGLPKDFGPPRLPPPHKPWEVSYEYVCPPLPSSTTFDKKTHTMYIWGDLDFDDYGESHKTEISDRCRQVHPCAMNQIVPQVMIGYCLSSNDENYNPSWQAFDSWVIQAQYYWQDENGASRAMCGPLIGVQPEAVILTKILYDNESGSIRASIAVLMEDDKKEDPTKRSEIVIQRPFPHDPYLFQTWKDFFQQCMDAEPQSPLQRLFGCCGGGTHPSLRGAEGNMKGALGRPYLNVEYKGRVDMETLKSVCPFVIREASFPGLRPCSTHKWHTTLYCPRTGRVDRLDDPEKSNPLNISDAVSLMKEKVGID